MFLNICKGWLYCFREPGKFINTDVPHALISESDFCNYHVLEPKEDDKTGSPILAKILIPSL